MKLTIAATLAVALVLACASGAMAASWKLRASSALEYGKLETTEKANAEKWLGTLPDASYRESFRQLIMGLVIWVSREPEAFIDYEFMKLFEEPGERLDIYTFKAGEAMMVTGIYSPPVLPGDL